MVEQDHKEQSSDGWVINTTAKMIILAKDRDWAVEASFHSCSVDKAHCTDSSSSLREPGSSNRALLRKLFNKSA